MACSIPVHDELNDSGICPVGSHDAQPGRAKYLGQVSTSAPNSTERQATAQAAAVFCECVPKGWRSQFGAAAGVGPAVASKWASEDDLAKPSLRHLFLAATKHREMVAAIGRALIQATESKQAGRSFSDRVMDLFVGVGDAGWEAFGG